MLFCCTQYYLYLLLAIALIIVSSVTEFNVFKEEKNTRAYINGFVVRSLLQTVILIDQGQVLIIKKPKKQ